MRVYFSFIFLFLASTIANAQSTYGGCISTGENSYQGMDIINNCSETLNITYCVESAGGSFSCDKKPFGMKTLRPGGRSFIPFYKSDGSGKIYWAACKDPDAAYGWAGRNTRFECR